MAEGDDQVLDEVRALRAEVDRAIRGITLLVRHLGAAPRPAAEEGPRVASDAELDSGTGDPEVRKDPKRWKGDSYQGQRMSACPPDYLDTLADSCDWKADKDRDEAAGITDPAERAKKLGYSRGAAKEAALARGWARRLRARPAEEEPL